MTNKDKEKMFLDLNGVLVKFWIEQGRPDKEVKVELLERMLHWYKEMGYIVQDNLENSTETIGDDLEEAAKQYALLFADGSKWMDDGKYRGFIAGANWQKEQLKDKDNER